MIYLFIHREALERNRVRDTDEPCINVVDGDELRRVHEVTLCCPACGAAAGRVRAVAGRQPLTEPAGVLGVRAWVEAAGRIVETRRNQEAA